MANRASWASPTTQLFLQLLVEEKNIGNWSGKSATKKGYENVGNKLRRISGDDFNKAQLKNKFDSLRGMFHLYTNMFSGQTGAGYDYATGNITMPDAWWDAKVQENEMYKKFRRNGLENADLMYTVFGDSSATGAYEYTPTQNASNIAHQSGHDETLGGDDTPPATPRLNQDLNEDINSPPPSGRSRLSGSKRKVSADDSWKTTVESLQKTFSECAQPAEFVVKHVQVDEDAERTQRAMDILYSLPNVVPGDHLFFLGLSLIEDKHKRNIFLALRTDADRLMWLQMQDK